MATLEDKILGEKLHNYCSSSEGENSDDDSEKSDEPKHQEPESLPTAHKWSGTASNTGPKGVMEDWRRYKQLEAEYREETEKERIALAKKLTLTVPTSREDEKAKADQELEDELKELLDDDILQKFQQQRMQELISQLNKARQFGKVYTLHTQNEFLEAIDKEDPNVTVIIHIYDHVDACKTMDGCLSVLSSEYPTVKFCRIDAANTKLSRNFREEGVPALLVYKNGQIIGNFVQLTSEFGSDFFAVDVERFLTEYGLLPLK